MPLDTSLAITKFQAYILRFYHQYGRHDLPWRSTYDPYQIMVSELMLQQTQVDRVIPKYQAFLERFPNSEALATAPVSAVIQTWQGLGYNRRGLLLQRAAQQIQGNFGGQVPTETSDLVSLPGIGPYTAAAIQAFAFNQPAIVIETNIRTVYISHFFHGAYNVQDAELLPLIEKTMDRTHPRRWYSALMDYGTYLKSVLPNPSRQSRHYSRQSQFKGSNREVRGAILRQLASSVKMSEADLQVATGFSYDRLQPAMEQLLKEGFVEYEATYIRLKG